VRVKDISSFEWTPGVSNALSASLDGSYQQYFIATVRRASTKEAERGIAAMPEEKRYLTRVLDSLDNAFADFDTDTVLLDLPHMRNRKPEAIKRYLEVRLLQLKKLVGVVGNYVEGNHPTAGGHS
jgi:hypothetical protein